MVTAGQVEHTTHTVRCHLSEQEEKLSGGVAHNKKLMIDHAQQCIQSASDYFNGQLSSTLQRPLEAFKAARYSFINQSSKGFSIL